MLDGPRLVLAQETQPGRKWDETRIKLLTGGDKISARKMRQDFYEFIPHFKIAIAGNHKPRLTTVDEAIRRRFRVIPCDHTVAVEQRDKSLDEKLQKEWPGILQWMIDGCVDYYCRDGLDPPARVVRATEEYLQAEDLLSDWINECCEVGHGLWGKSSDLFNNWRQWADAANEPVGRLKNFRERLENAGFKYDRSYARNRHYQGIRLKQERVSVRED